MTKLEKFKNWLAEDESRKAGLERWGEILAEIDKERFEIDPFGAVLEKIKGSNIDNVYLEIVLAWEKQNKINDQNQESSPNPGEARTEEEFPASEEEVDWMQDFQTWLTQHPNDLPNWEKFIGYFFFEELYFELENIFWVVKEWDEKDGDLMEYWKLFVQWIRLPPTCKEERIEKNDDYFNFLIHQGKIKDYQTQIKELEGAKDLLQTRLWNQEQKIKELSNPLAEPIPPYFLWIILLMVVIWMIK